MSIYQFAISNMKQFLRSDENRNQPSPLTAFEAANVLGIAFVKPQESVLAELLAD